MTFKPSDSTGDTNEPDSPFFDSFEAAAGGTKLAAATCTFEKKTYNKGATICWGGKVHECGDNGWINLGKKC